MAVKAKDFSAAFFHISSLKNANTRNNTAASKQPNLFWFWEKFIYIHRGDRRYCGKTEDLKSREPKEIETSATRRFEDNRLNCVVGGLNIRKNCFETVL